MVNISDNTLIIKISCNGVAPLEKLAYIQTGLIDLIAMVDHSEIPSQEVANALDHLRTLLKEMMLDPIQLRTFNELISKGAELKSLFN